MGECVVAMVTRVVGEVRRIVFDCWWFEVVFELHTLEKSKVYLSSYHDTQRSIQ